MPSLGELFISLGFDVDDQKLKTFQRNLRDTHEEMVKLGTVAATTVGALALFMKSASDQANALDNLKERFGANTQAAQTFGNAIHVLDTAISKLSGQNQYARFAQLIGGEIPLGSPAGNALSMLGAYHPGQTPEEAFWGLVKGYHAAENQLAPGGTQEQKDELYTHFLSMIPGMENAKPVISKLADHPEFWNQMAQYDQSDAALAKTKKYSEAVGLLDNAFDKLFEDLETNLGGPLKRTIHALVDALNYADNAANAHPLAAGVLTVGGVTGGSVLAWKATRAIIKSLFGGESAATVAESTAASAGGGSFLLPFLATLGTLFYPSGSDADRLTPEQKAAQDKFNREREGTSTLSSDPQERKRQMILEIFDADADRQDVKTVLGPQKPMDYSYYTRSAPATSQNITINVHSNATDNREVATIVQQHIQDMHNRTAAQTNLQPY